MKLWKTIGLFALAATATPVLAATDHQLESAEAGLKQIEPRGAGELRASGNDQTVHADAVKWSEVWGPTVPKAERANAGDPVRADSQTIGVLGRS